MANSHFKHVKITGICTVVPSKKIRLDDEIQYYPDVNKLNRLKTTVGLNERSVVDEGTTPADLMEYAAKKILQEMNVDKKEIDALICVLDNPDYKCPPTSCILQGKLGLPDTCMAFDITHGCAGYIYGLNVAFSMVENGYKKILLLVGDTKSTTINIKDRISAPIFGDGASATMIEHTKDNFESWFSIGAKGDLYENIMIPAGGARIPCSEETTKEIIDEFGNTRSLNNFRMNGRNVFDFTIAVVPQNIQETLDLAQLKSDNIDYFILHQANKSIIQNIALRVGIKDKSKVLTETLSKYGNLAVASIPSAINDQLSDINDRKRLTVCLSGFGVGLAYGSVILTLYNTYIPEPFIYKGEKNE